jgi:hypothetical protein
MSIMRTTAEPGHHGNDEPVKTKTGVLRKEAAPPRPALEGESGLSWNGFNIRGDKKSIEAVSAAIHSHCTEPVLRERITTLSTQLAEAETENERLVNLSRLLIAALERAKMWLYLDDGSPYADEETRAIVNETLGEAERQHNV